MRDAFHAAYAAAVKEHTPVDEPVEEASDAVAESDPEPAPATEPVQADSALTSDEAFAKLQTDHANDPAALRKALNTDYTRKLQGLAEERKTYERVKDFLGFIEAYEADPAAAVKQLASMHGLLQQEAAKPAPDPKVDGPAPAPKPSEFDFDMDRWAVAHEQWAQAEVERRAQAILDKSLEPIRSQTKGLVDKVAGEQTAAIMDAFEKAHPDWRTHEKAMTDLAAKLNPNGMSESDYLEHLYNTVTFESRVNREADGRFKKRIEKMNTAESGEKIQGTPDAQVRRRIPEGLSFAKAFEDAKNGIRYDDD